MASENKALPKFDARDYIKIRGAREHNLKNIDVNIPRNKLVVLTRSMRRGRGATWSRCLPTQGSSLDRWKSLT